MLFISFFGKSLTGCIDLIVELDDNRLLCKLCGTLNDWTTEHHFDQLVLTSNRQSLALVPMLCVDVALVSLVHELVQVRMIRNKVLEYPLVFVILTWRVV